jgi:hypothetical protein
MKYHKSIENYKKKNIVEIVIRMMCLLFIDDKVVGKSHFQSDIATNMYMYVYRKYLLYLSS